jgi:hypothetical protein
MDNHNLGQRLRTLLDKGGDDLAKGLTEEIEFLYRELALLRREVLALADYQSGRGLDLVVPEAPTATLPDSVVVGAEQMLRLHDGFHPLEHSPDGIPFRWTGPSVQFSFSVFIDRNAATELRLQALSVIDFELQKSLTLVVDGEIVPVEVMRQGGGLEIAAILPPRYRQGVTSLVFVLPAVLVPRGGNDTRPLGIAFTRLSVTASAAQPVMPDRMAAQ